MPALRSSRPTTPRCSARKTRCLLRALCHCSAQGAFLCATLDESALVRYTKYLRLWPQCVYKRRENRRDFRQVYQPLLPQARACTAFGYSVAADGGLYPASHPGAVPAGHQWCKPGAGGGGRPDDGLHQRSAVPTHLPAHDLHCGAHGHRAFSVARLFLRLGGPGGGRPAGADV